MSIGTGENLSGAVKPSSLEQAIFEGALWATRMTEIPSNMGARWAYNADSTLLYAGFAPKGLAEGTDGWLMHKFEYDASKRATSRKIAYGNWTARATYTFE